jgi:DNA-directed RNA polymerase subunit RPC12/RpoP
MRESGARSGVKSGIIATILLLVAIPSGFIFIQNFGMVGIIAWIVAAGALIVLMIKYHSKETGYRCPACGSRFKISMWQDLFSPHTGSGKKIRCPSCGKTEWCEVI